MTARKGRNPGDITPAEFTTACRELEALVAERLPERFYRSEPSWRLAASALIARSVGILQSTAILLEAGRPTDAAALLRVQYEHVVTFCWLMIDPRERAERWADHAARYRLKLHREALRYDVAVLTEAELETAKAAKEMPALEQRAAEVDDYWGTRSPAFRPPSSTGWDHILTMRGLYTGLYRITSRGQHAQLDAMDAAVDNTKNPWRVVLEDRGDPNMIYLGLPLVGLMLVAGSQRLGWPDVDRVNEISDALMREP